MVEALFLAPHATREEYLYVTGSGARYSREQLEEKRRLWVERLRESGNRAGEPFAFTSRMMKAAIFTNVVYPIERHGRQIVHYTPGKRWDSLYT